MLPPTVACWSTPPTIPNPTGLKFTTVIISEAYTEMVLNIFDANGQLMGTEWKVPFTNNQFLIWDQVSNQTWNPFEADMQIEIPEHPDERIAEGPDDEWVRIEDDEIKKSKKSGKKKNVD